MYLEARCALASIPWALPHGCELLGSSYLGGGTNKTLWMDHLKPRTRKITYRPSGQTQTFSVTMKNSILISILAVSVLLCSPSLCACYFSLFKIYLLISSMVFYILIFILSFIWFTFLFIHSFETCVLFYFFNLLSRNYRFFSMALIP